MSQNKRILLTIVLGILVTLLMLWWRHTAKEVEPANQQEEGDISSTTKNGGSKVSLNGHTINQDDNPVASRESITAGTSYAAAVKNLDSALDDEDVELILKEVEKLKKHPDPEVRGRVAFALSWTGLKGFSELTSMLIDPDPEVASEALDHWKTVLAEVSNEYDKAELLGTAAKILGGDISDEALFDIIMELSMLEDEYALPQLVVVMQSVSKPDQKEEVIEAIHSTMELDAPSDNEAILATQALEEAKRLAMERAAEEAEEALQ